VIRVTADSNITISALTYPGGKPSRLLDLARKGEIILTVSEAILDEIADVLARKFKFTPERLAVSRKFITDVARTVHPSTRLNVIKEDPDDDRILECAVAAGSDYIVSGDNDLLRLSEYDGIHIVKVADFIDLMLRRRR
jgi:uncharacterized protein